MKRMLINATQQEELRMAMVDGQLLYDLNIELPSGERKKANIYKGKITRVEPSLEAAFVDYGADRHGFLPLKEVSSEYFINDVSSSGKPSIREVLKEGQDIVVQIDKEERGNKGAALTTYVSLAGRFIVLKPNKAKSGGVSRRIVGEDRDLARQSLGGVDIPDGMSVILRTAGIDRDSEELEWDLNNLLAIWEAIKSVVLSRPSPFLIYRESNPVVRALRDYLTNEVGEILIDDEEIYKEAQEFVEQVMPHNQRKLKHYVDSVPLFTRYQIESQIESAFAHSVNLPSGGSIVIDHTEALVAIDINSARATKGSDIEETAYHTNLEAAEEVGRQLRLRDLGGLIVIDFIDMGPQKNQRAVETRLRDAVRQDRARVQFGKISRFGLLEMSRQRLRPSLGDSSNLSCPRCNGIGNIRSVESLALAILRLIGEEARKDRTAKVVAQLPVEVATYLLNEKREWVQSLESRHEMQVILIANPLLETPHYQVRRIRDDQLDLPENTGTSYALIESEDEQIIPQAIQRKPAELAAVATVAATTPPPVRKRAVKQGPGLWAWILGLFSSDEKPARGKKRASGRRPQKGSDGRSRGGQRTRRGAQSQKSGDGRQKPRQKQTSKKTAKKSDSKGSKRSKQRKSSDDRKTDEKKEATVAQATPQDGTEETRSETRKSGSRRRSRGGRRRRRGQDRAESATQSDESKQATTESGSDASAEIEDRPIAAVPAPISEISSKPVQPATDKPIETIEAGEPMEDESDAKSAAPVEITAPEPAIVETSKDRQQEPGAEQTKAVLTSYNVDYEDTQPSLPVLSDPNEAKDAIGVDDKPKEVKAESRSGGSPEREKTEARSNESAEQDNAAMQVTETPKEDRTESAENEESKPEKAETGADDRPKRAVNKEQTEAKASSEGNGDSPTAVAGDKNSSATPESDEKKPEGRLLPWEPQAAPSEQSPDKDASS